MRYKFRLGIAVSSLVISSASLSGCAGGIGAADDSAKPSTLASLLAFNQTTPPPMSAETPKVQEVVCPHIEVLDGASTVRVGGQTNESVRYQYSLGTSARQCTAQGNQIAIKIGIEGRVLLGPAGAPGNFNVPVRFAIVQDTDRKPIASQLETVAVKIPAGQSEASFSAVSQSILIPNHGDSEDEDYTVLIGFDTGKSIAPTGKHKPKRKH